MRAAEEKENFDSIHRRVVENSSSAIVPVCHDAEGLLACMCDKKFKQTLRPVSVKANFVS